MHSFITENKHYLTHFSPHLNLNFPNVFCSCGVGLYVGYIKLHKRILEFAFFIAYECSEKMSFSNS